MKGRRRRKGPGRRSGGQFKEAQDGKHVGPVTAEPDVPGSFTGGVKGWDPCAVSKLAFVNGTESFVQPTVDPTSLETARALAYVTAIGDGLGVFDAADQIRQAWLNGAAITFHDTALLDDLYCAERVRTQITRPQRMALAAMLGIEDDDLPPGTPVNTEFRTIFGRIINACLRFRQEQCECRDGSAAAESGWESASRKAAELIWEQARWNLHNKVTGIAMMQTRELSEKLRQDCILLAHPDVAQYLYVPGGNVFSALAAVHGTPGDRMVNVVAQEQAAKARDLIFSWLQGIGTFDDAVAGAIQLDATESLMTGLPPGYPALSALTA